MTTHLDTLLRLSILQADLLSIAEKMEGNEARIVRYAASVLNLLKSNPGDGSVPATPRLTSVL